jgi:hypothetical protein
MLRASPLDDGLAKDDWQKDNYEIETPSNCRRWGFRLLTADED